jgi:uncharacterized protein (TIGR00369 family)
MGTPSLEVWEEPVRGGYTDAADFLAKSGLELLGGYFTDGQLPPPIHYLTGLTFTHAESGKATFTMPVTDWLLAPQGVVSGSTLALLADGPLACAVQTALPAASPYTTAEMSLSFIRTVQPGDGLLSCHGTLIHAGRTVGLADARITDERDRLVATATTRCIILPRVEASVAPGLDGHVVNEPQWPRSHPFQRAVEGEILPPDVWQRLSGLDILLARISGDLPAPPIARLCGIRPTLAEEGRTTWQMPASEWLCSPVQGRVYAGAIAYLAGTGLDGTYQSVISANSAFAPVDMKVYFLRPVEPDGRDMVATGTITSRGRSVVIATSEVVAGNGKRVAIAVGSALLLRSRSPSLASPVAAVSPD